MGIDENIKINNIISSNYRKNLLESLDEEAGTARLYLSSRDVTKHDIFKWDLGCAFNGLDDDYKVLSNYGYKNIEMRDAGIVIQKVNRFFDRFRNRIMFPIKNENGDIEGFTGRALNDYDGDYKVAKYLNSPDSELFDKGSSIFGMDKAAEYIVENDCVIIMEGQFDVITSHRVGIKNSVACSGTSLTENHLKILSNYTKNIVICFDSDDAGVKASIKAVTNCKNLGFNVEILPLKDGDPDEILRKDCDAFEELEAISGDNYLIDVFKKNKDSELLLKYLNILNNNEQELFLDKLKKKCTYK